MLRVIEQCERAKRKPDKRFRLTSLQLTQRNKAELAPTEAKANGSILLNTSLQSVDIFLQTIFFGNSDIARRGLTRLHRSQPLLHPLFTSHILPWV